MWGRGCHNGGNLLLIPVSDHSKQFNPSPSKTTLLSFLSGKWYLCQMYLMWFLEDSWAFNTLLGVVVKILPLKLYFAHFKNKIFFWTFFFKTFNIPIKSKKIRVWKRANLVERCSWLQEMAKIMSCIGDWW